MSQAWLLPPGSFRLFIIRIVYCFQGTYLQGTKLVRIPDEPECVRTIYYYRNLLHFLCKKIKQQRRNDQKITGT